MITANPPRRGRGGERRMPPEGGHDRRAAFMARKGMSRRRSGPVIHGQHAELRAAASRRPCASSSCSVMSTSMPRLGDVIDLVGFRKLLMGTSTAPCRGCLRGVMNSGVLQPKATRSPDARRTGRQFAGEASPGQQAA